jgi:hypothetical protein
VAEPLPLAPKSLPAPSVPLTLPLLPSSGLRLGPRKLALPPADDDDEGSDMRCAATAPLSGLLAADGVPEEPLVAPLLPEPPLPAAEAAAWNPKRRTACGVPGEGARKRYSRSMFNNRERASL